MATAERARVLVRAAMRFSIRFFFAEKLVGRATACFTFYAGASVCVLLKPIIERSRAGVTGELRITVFFYYRFSKSSKSKTVPTGNTSWRTKSGSDWIQFNPHIKVAIPRSESVYQTRPPGVPI